ncbi:MAG: hypothetical protein K5840_04630, partial [Eubacterium sp.]|nr:hypothetical protein [Eubacterium sp.]
MNMSSYIQTQYSPYARYAAASAQADPACNQALHRTNVVAPENTDEREAMIHKMRELIRGLDRVAKSNPYLPESGRTESGFPELYG